MSRTPVATQPEEGDRSSGGLQERITKAPALIKMLLFIGGGLTTLTVVGAVFSLAGNLISNPVQRIGEPVAIGNVVAPPGESEKPTDPMDLEAQRQAAWEQVKAASAGLRDSTAELENQIRFARAQRWQMFANEECREQGPQQCPSTYSWLLATYRAKAADLQRRMFAGRLTTDSETVSAFRADLGALNDIGAALALEISGTPPRTFIPTAEINGAIESVYEKAGNFEAARQSAAIRSYEGQQPRSPQVEPQIQRPPAIPLEGENQ